MSKSKEPLAIGLAFKQAPPANVDAGAQFAFSVLPQWPQGFGPGGGTYALRARDKTLLSGDLPWSEAEDGSIAFAVTAPEETGDHRFVLDVAIEKSGEQAGAQGSLAFALRTLPHETSLAVWNHPSPVVRGSAFEVKAGAKCTSACTLSGREVEILDEADEPVGRGVLGDAPFEGTASLYWTSVALKAPRKKGQHSWSVRFAPTALKLAHGASAARFSFVTVDKPEHSVSVKVVNKATKEPIAGAQLRLGIYRAVTDENGAASLRVPTGEFPLIVTRAGYEMPDKTVAVAKDMRVRVPATKLPEEDPFAAWTA